MHPKNGSLSITPTRNCTHFLKSVFVVAGGGFFPIIFIKEINQIKNGNCKKKNKLNVYKKIYYIFKLWVQFRVGAISRLPQKNMLKNLHSRVVYT